MGRPVPHVQVHASGPPEIGVVQDHQGAGPQLLHVNLRHMRAVLHRPIQGGHGVLRALARPDAKTVPIVAMTANAFQEDKNAALASGMNGFIPKPIDMSQLFQELRRVLKAHAH